MSQGQRKGWRYDQATGYLYVYVDGVAAAYFNDSSPYLTIASGLTVTSGGITITAGGLTVTAGDVSIAGNVSHTAGKFISGSPQKLTITEKADSATLAVAEAGVIVVTVDAKTMTLPAVSGNAGLRYIVKVECAHTSGTVVDGAGSETIDGATTKTSGAQFDVLDIICDGDEWHIVGRIGTWS